MPLCITSNTLLVSERKLSSEDRSLAEGLSWVSGEYEDSYQNLLGGIDGPASMEARYRQDREVVGQLRDGLSILERSSIKYQLRFLTYLKFENRLRLFQP